MLGRVKSEESGANELSGSHFKLIENIRRIFAMNYTVNCYIKNFISIYMGKNT